MARTTARGLVKGTPIRVVGVSRRRQYGHVTRTGINGSAAITPPIAYVEYRAAATGALYLVPVSAVRVDRAAEKRAKADRDARV